jgi:hypothetical protein
VVKGDVDIINRFNGFCSSFAEKTVERIFQSLATRLKPGVNDKSLQVALQSVHEFNITEHGPTSFTVSSRSTQSHTTAD